jgi:hypothetical protein
MAVRSTPRLFGTRKEVKQKADAPGFLRMPLQAVFMRGRVQAMPA